MSSLPLPTGLTPLPVPIKEATPLVADGGEDLPNFNSVFDLLIADEPVPAGNAPELEEVEEATKPPPAPDAERAEHPDEPKPIAGADARADIRADAPPTSSPTTGPETIQTPQASAGKAPQPQRADPVESRPPRATRPEGAASIAPVTTSVEAAQTPPRRGLQEVSQMIHTAPPSANIERAPPRRNPAETAPVETAPVQSAPVAVPSIAQTVAPPKDGTAFQPDQTAKVTAPALRETPKVAMGTLSAPAPDRPMATPQKGAAQTPVAVPASAPVPVQALGAVQPTPVIPAPQASVQGGDPMHAMPAATTTPQPVAGVPLQKGADPAASVVAMAPEPRQTKREEPRATPTATPPSGMAFSTVRHPAPNAPQMAAPTWANTLAKEVVQIDTADLRLAEISTATPRLEGALNTAQPLAPSRADLAPQIARQLAEVLPQATHRPVEITLSPEELGRVRLSLTLSETQVTVNLLAERPETLDLLRRHIDLLGQEFRNLGYETVSFAFGEDADGPPSENPDGGTRDSPTHLDDAPEPGVATLRGSTSDGLDLRL